MKVFIVIIIVGALGTTLKEYEKRIGEVEIQIEFYPDNNTAEISKNSRRVLENLGDLLSLGFFLLLV